MPNIQLIEEAAAYLKGKIRRTPREESGALSGVTGVATWLKLESLQLTGSFKIQSDAMQGTSRDPFMKIGQDASLVIHRVEAERSWPASSNMLSNPSGVFRCGQ